MIGGPQFFDEALAEYEAAVVYYERRETGLAARFVQELRHSRTWKTFPLISIYVR